MFIKVHLYEAVEREFLIRIKDIKSIENSIDNRRIHFYDNSFYYGKSFVDVNDSIDILKYELNKKDK